MKPSATPSQPSSHCSPCCGHQLQGGITWRHSASVVPTSSAWGLLWHHSVRHRGKAQLRTPGRTGIWHTGTPWPRVTGKPTDKCPPRLSLDPFWGTDPLSCSLRSVPKINYLRASPCLKLCFLGDTRLSHRSTREPWGTAPRTFLETDSRRSRPVNHWNCSKAIGPDFRPALQVSIGSSGRNALCQRRCWNLDKGCLSEFLWSAHSTELSQ